MRQSSGKLTCDVQIATFYCALAFGCIARRLSEGPASDGPVSATVFHIYEKNKRASLLHREEGGGCRTESFASKLHENILF